MNKKENPTTKETLLQDIKSGDIKMKPKMHFVLQTIALALVIVLISGLILYLISFVGFMLRMNGAFLLPSFGFHGLSLLFLSLPWLLVAIIVLLIGTLEILGRHFSFIYRRPLVYTILCIVFLSLFAGSLLAGTSLHKGGFQASRLHQTGLIDPLYKQYRDKITQGKYTGTITNIESTGFTIETSGGEIISVATTTKTRFPREINFEIGDRVLIIGDKVDDIVQAFGIRTFNSLMLEMHMRPPRQLLDI